MHLEIWSFLVKNGCERDFERLYGPEGDWVAVFRQGRGYVGTELLKDNHEQRRYFTIDRWESAAGYHAFRHEFAAEFAEIDKRGEELTEDEVNLGSFHLVS